MSGVDSTGSADPSGSSADLQPASSSTGPNKAQPVLVRTKQGKQIVIAKRIPVHKKPQKPEGEKAKLQDSNLQKYVENSSTCS